MLKRLSPQTVPKTRVTLFSRVGKLLGFSNKGNEQMSPGAGKENGLLVTANTNLSTLRLQHLAHPKFWDLHGLMIPRRNVSHRQACKFIVLQGPEMVISAVFTAQVALRSWHLVGS